MEPSPERIEQLKEIYKQETGKELSDKQAYKEMRRIIGLAELALKEYEKEKRSTRSSKLD